MRYNVLVFWHTTVNNIKKPIGNKPVGFHFSTLIFTYIMYMIFIIYVFYVPRIYWNTRINKQTKIKPVYDHMGLDFVNVYL